MRRKAAFLASWIGASTAALGGDFAAVVEKNGVHSLTFEQCLNHFGDEKIGHIEVTQEGVACASWLDDADENGAFNAGDRLIFLAHTTNNQGEGFETRYPPVRIRNLPGKKSELRTRVAIAPEKGELSSGFELAHRVEKNHFRACIRGADFNNADRFFWQRLTSLDDSPLEIDLLENAPELTFDTGKSASARLSVVGITTFGDETQETPEHDLTLSVRDSALIQNRWSGSEEHLVELTDLNPADLRKPIGLRLTERFANDGNFIADIVFLNWTEVSIPLVEVPKDFSGQARIVPIQGEPHLSTESEALTVYQTTGESWELRTSGSFRIPVDPDATATFLVGPKGEVPVADTHPWRNPDLSFIARGDIDYLAIVPEGLASEIAPLLQAHSISGLKTHLLLVEDCYDAFGNGNHGPESIREAIRQWHERRASPDTLAYVLLAGDASSEIPGKGRNLIPTWTLPISESLCASDNPYACLEGDDNIPDLAIGRLPVATKEEMERVVEKTLSMLSPESLQSDSPFFGLWISDHNEANSKRAVAATKALRKFDIEGEVIHPLEDEPHRARITRIKEALFKGPDFAAYVGHGSRHSWQTGGADYAEQSSLFTTDLLGDWPKQGVRPIRAVISITCDSAPFDHSTDDSLGECFLTMEHGGAVGFIGASWRIEHQGSLPFKFATAILKSKTVGEAFWSAKSNLRHRPVLESFNLLGDPAVPLKNEVSITATPEQ